MEGHCVPLADALRFGGKEILFPPPPLSAGYSLYDEGGVRFGFTFQVLRSILFRFILLTVLSISDKVILINNSTFNWIKNNRILLLGIFDLIGSALWLAYFFT